MLRDLLIAFGHVIANRFFVASEFSLPDFDI
jgi:hypothetical protein